MTVSHARVIIIGLVVSFLVNGIITSNAVGQGSNAITLSAPQKLKPERRSQPPRSPSSNLYQGYAAEPKVKSLNSIQVKSLDEVNVSALGVLNNKEGGFNANLWEGSRLSFIKRLLEKHTLQGRSIVIRRLLRRVLLTGAMPPKGTVGSAFIEMRLKALMKMGDFDAGLKLVNAVPRKSRAGLIRKLEMELHLISGNSTEACAMVASEVTHRLDSLWQKALIYCALLAGETSRAELGVSLLQEKEDGDPAFLTLAQGILDDQPKLPEITDSLDVLNIAMLKLAKLEIPISILRKYPAALITTSTNTGTLERLDAIEIAAEYGLLSDTELRKRYLAALPSSGSFQYDKEEVITSLDRGLLYLKAMENNIPMAKAEVLERVMGSARSSGRMGGVARLFSPVIKSMTPENDLLWVAPSAFRASLISGLWNSATSWFGLARRNAAFSPDASTIFQGLSLLGTILKRDVGVLPKSISMEKLSTDQKILYLTLFTALGGEVSQVLLDELVYESQPLKALPDPVLWQKLTKSNYRQAGELNTAEPKVTDLGSDVAVVSAGQLGEKVNRSFKSKDALKLPLKRSDLVMETSGLGERILVMSGVLGNGPLSELSPLVIAEVVRGLRKAGLEAEAHGLAMEAAINAGL